MKSKNLTKRKDFKEENPNENNKKEEKMGFTLYRVCRTKRTAQQVAYSLRNQGYYVRIRKTASGYEIWVKPRSFWDRF